MRAASRLRRGAPELWGVGAISGPHHLRRLSRRATALPGRDERWGFGGPSRGPITCDGYRGAPRLCRGATSAGGSGGHLGAPSPATAIEARHGFAGARRALGVRGAISGPHHLRRLSRRATALPGRDERWGF